MLTLKKFCDWIGWKYPLPHPESPKGDLVKPLPKRRSFPELPSFEGMTEQQIIVACQKYQLAISVWASMP